MYLNGETLIIASYYENKMIDCQIYPDLTGDEKFVTADVLNIKGETKVRAFLWKDLNSLMPVCACAEEEL